MSISFANASKLKAELISGISQKKLPLNIDARKAKGERLIKEYAHTLKEDSQEAYIKEIQGIIEGLSDMQPQKEVARVPEEVSEVPMKLKDEHNAPDKDLTKKVADLEKELEESARALGEETRKRHQFKMENDDLKWENKKMRTELLQALGDIRELKKKIGELEGNRGA